MCYEYSIYIFKFNYIYANSKVLYYSHPTGKIIDMTTSRFTECSKIECISPEDCLARTDEHNDQSS